MNVGTISLVGISVVFFTFVVLFLLFKLLARLFGDKQYRKFTTHDKPELSLNGNPKSTKRNTTDITSEETNPELVAAIMTAICAFNSNNIQIISIKEKRASRGVPWKTQKIKIWRPLRKGVKKAW